jgi:general secretion pathway protein G
MLQRSGFTLIELLVVLAVVGTLLALAAPRYVGSVDRARELVLRENLATLRTTLDKFHADTGAYPESLDQLVSKRYLRSVPVDPLLDNNRAWLLVPPPQGVRGAVYDVRSSATGQASDGRRYQEW